MISSFIEPDLFIERKQFAVDARAQKAFLGEFLEFFFEFPFTTTNDRRQHHDALAFRQAEHVLHDLINALARDRRAADMAMWNAH